MGGSRIVGRDWLLALALGVFALFGSAMFASRVPVGAPPDEWAHLTYVNEIATGHRLMPDYAGSVILNSTRLNYLNHPPLYYTAVGTVGRVLGWKVPDNVSEYRLLSAAFVALGVGLWVLAIRLLGGSRWLALGSAVATLSIPMFPYLSASVNNDTLGYLGVAIFFLGIGLRRSNVGIAYYVGAIGLLVAALTKANAAFFLIVFTAAWLGLRLRAGENLFRDRYFRRSLLLVMVVAGAYFGYARLRYGSLFPHAGDSYAWTHPAHLMGFGRYVGAFLRAMTGRLPDVMSHQSYAPLPASLLAPFYLMLLLPLASWILYRPFAPTGERRDLSDAFMGALAVTVAANVMVGWYGYTLTGLLAGIQPRYYSYALPGVFLAAFVDGQEIRIKQWAFCGFALLASALLAVMPGASMWKLREAPSQASSTPALSYSPAAAQTLQLRVNASGGTAGYVDSLTVSGGALTAAGWAIDVHSKAASTVWVVEDGRVIATARAVQSRPDVAKALGSPAAATSGFRVRIVGMPAGLDACALHFYAEQQREGLSELKVPSCGSR